MSNIDFYILSKSGEKNRHQFVCRLTEKAYNLKNKIHINLDNNKKSTLMDSLLWTFRNDSFLPHSIINLSSKNPETPITLGISITPVERYDLLINLAENIPNDAKNFPRIAEIITSDEDIKSSSRKRYVDYRDQGHKLTTHKL